MSLVAEYRASQRDERLARLRRAVALRAMTASGMSQRDIAQALGVSQPAVSQQMKSARLVSAVLPGELVEAAAPVLRQLAADAGFEDLAVFGSVARGAATADSDIDLLVRSPAGTSTFAFLRFKQQLEDILGSPVDLVDYGGLTPGLDDDIRREARLL